MFYTVKSAYKNKCDSVNSACSTTTCALLIHTSLLGSSTVIEFRFLTSNENYDRVLLMISLPPSLNQQKPGEREGFKGDAREKQPAVHPKRQKRGCPEEESAIELGAQPRPLNKEKRFYKLDEKGWNKERQKYSR